VLWLKRAIERHGNRQIRGERMLPKRVALEWILLAALMNFGSKRQSLTAEIRNFYHQADRNCEKQTNTPS